MRKTPVPIPNTVEKTHIGENTWRATAWEDNSLPAPILEERIRLSSLFFYIKDFMDKISAKNSFTGIRLSRSSFNDVKNVVMDLKYNNVNVLGYRISYVNNDFNSKLRLFRHFRVLNNFQSNEVGVIFLPWSKEAYLMGTHSYEQQLFPILKKNRSIC